MLSLRWRILEAPEPVLPELLQGRLHGVTLPGVMGEAARDALLAALPGSSLTRHALLQGEPAVFSYGHMLAPSEPEPRGADPAAYLNDAERDRPFFVPVQAALLPCLAALSGLPAELAILHGRPCAFATIRVMPPGREIPLHRDTYQNSPIWEALAPLCDPSTRLSWYVALNAAGGHLEVLPEGGLEYGALVAGEPVPLAPGDLVLFDAGRLFHRVRPGPGTRLTLGGFVAPSADGRRLLCWG